MDKFKNEIDPKFVWESFKSFISKCRIWKGDNPFNYLAFVKTFKDRLDPEMVDPNEIFRLFADTFSYYQEEKIEIDEVITPDNIAVFVNLNGFNPEECIPYLYEKIGNKTVFLKLVETVIEKVQNSIIKAGICTADEIKKC